MEKAEQVLQILRDIFRLFAAFARDMGSFEKAHDFSISKLDDAFGDLQSKEFIDSLARLDPKAHTAFIKTAAAMIGLAEKIKDITTLSPSDELSAATQLDDLANDIESAIGSSQFTSRPTDLDKSLIERCANKDYHDVVTNAFPLLEDVLRSKLGVTREEYFGDKLIDYGFNPTTSCSPC